MIHFIATTGSDTLSLDYVAHVPLIVSMLWGHYHWQNFLADTFYNRSHSFAIPDAIRLLIVRLTHWSVYPELYIGVIAAFAKLALLYSAIVRRNRSRWRWALLVVLAALVFSASQADDFTDTDVTMQFQFGQLGFALGLWGLVRFPRQWQALALMALGGAFGTLSGASGLPSWPAFLIGMILIGIRDIRWYLIWAGSAIATVWPYVYFRVIHPMPWTRITMYQHEPSSLEALFNPVSLLADAGFPFAQDMAPARAIAVGMMAVPLVAGTLLLVWKYRRLGLVQDTLPGLVIFVYGAVNIWLISVGRNAVAGWYVLSFIPIWFGLVGIIYVFWIKQPAIRSLRIWAVIFLVALGSFYSVSNVTFADKVWFLYTRAPVSASCLRNYRIAPLDCQSYIFNWGPSPIWFLSGMARPLEQHQLSVFAPDQEWDLQGDYILPTVRLKYIGTDNVFWSDGNKRFRFSDFRHLNLVLRAGNAIYWTIHLPANTVHATFRSAVATYGSTTEGAVAAVYVDSSSLPRQAVFGTTVSRRDGWSNIGVTLDKFAGKTVTLELTSKATRVGHIDWSTFRFPLIDVQLDPHRAEGTLPIGRFLAKPTSHDLVIKFDHPVNWRAHSVQLLRTSGRSAPEWIIGRNYPYLAYTLPLNACMGDYRQIYVRATFPRGRWPEDLVFYYRFGSQSKFARFNYMPLITDGRTHSYSYALRLLDVPSDARLKGLRIGFEDRPQERHHIHRISIDEIRLIRGPESGSCR